MNISNKVYKDLLKYKLVKFKNLEIISDICRDKKIRVIRDKKSKIIFLEENKINNYKYKKYFSKDKKYRILQVNNKNIKTLRNDDKSYRLKLFSKYFKNKKVLDFGCGYGDFLYSVQNAKSLSGIELNKNYIHEIKKKGGINIFSNINEVKGNFNTITMFHVLEHLDDQINTLKKIYELLNKNGYLIIEVPHAKDLLLNNENFKKFSFWSEHLILHTEKSIKKFLDVAGFKNIKISYYQRFGLTNHLKWNLDGKPDGHNDNFLKKIISKKIENVYRNEIQKRKRTDTIFAICKK